MLVKMLVSMAGKDFVLSPNEQTDRFSTKESQSLIDAGYAVPVTEVSQERAARKAAPEKRI